MPILDALVLSLIIALFVAFAVVLAWGEYQTRNLNRDIRQPVSDPSTAPGAVIQVTFDRRQSAIDESAAKKAA